MKEKINKIIKKIKKISKKAFKFIHKYYPLILAMLLLVIYVTTDRIYIIIPLVIMPILLIIDYHWVLKRKRNELNKIIKNYTETYDEIIKMNDTLRNELERITEIKLHLLKLGVITSKED